MPPRHQPTPRKPGIGGGDYELASSARRPPGCWPRELLREKEIAVDTEADLLDHLLRQDPSGPVESSTDRSDRPLAPRRARSSRCRWSPASRRRRSARSSMPPSTTSSSSTRSSLNSRTSSTTTARCGLIRRRARGTPKRHFDMFVFRRTSSVAPGCRVPLRETSHLHAAADVDVSRRLADVLEKAALARGRLDGRSRRSRALSAAPGRCASSTAPAICASRARSVLIRLRRCCATPTARQPRARGRSPAVPGAVAPAR